MIYSSHIIPYFSSNAISLRALRVEVLSFGNGSPIARADISSRFEGHSRIRIYFLFLIQNFSKPDSTKAQFTARKEHILDCSPDSLYILCPVVGIFGVHKSCNKQGSPCYDTGIISAFRDSLNSFLVPYNNKAPGLIVQPGRSPVPCIKYCVDIFLADRFIHKLPDTSSIEDSVNDFAFFLFWHYFPFEVTFLFSVYELYVQRRSIEYNQSSSIFLLSQGIHSRTCFPTISS